MITEDDVQNNHEDIQKQKRENSSMPTIPDENSIRKIFAPANTDIVIKTLTKEKNAENKNVSVIYPANPNTGN